MIIGKSIDPTHNHNDMAHDDSLTRNTITGLTICLPSLTN